MKYFKQLAAMVVAALMILPPIPAIAGTRKGDKLRNQARTEEVKGNLDKALDLTNQAVSEDPSDPAYLLQLHRVRFELGVQEITKARKLRDAGKLDEALAEYQKAYSVDPSSEIAVQEIRQTQAMIDRQKNGGASAASPAAPAGQAEKEDTSSLTPAELERKEQQERTDALMPVPVLRPLSRDLIDLKIINRPRVLFETLAARAGITVIFDPDYNTQQTITQPIQVDLHNTTLESALDELCLQTKSFWKPLPSSTPGVSNTIFVSFDNRNNRTQYTDQVVKVFYLSSPTTAQEIQEILTVLRTVFDVQKVFNYTAQNALVVRCDADTMALVEKEIADLDKPRSEVIVDVMIMQVSSTYSRQLGAGLNGFNSSVGFAPRTSIQTPSSTTNTNTATTSTTTTTGTTTTTPTTTTGTTTTPGASIPLSEIGHVSSADYSITNLPGATFEAMLSDSTTRVLDAPELRIMHAAKGSINIGEKIPIATGSFQSAVGAVGALPAANTQFSFQNVGVQVEITPQIHGTDQIGMHLDLEVSQVLDRINIGGVSEPEIADNKVTSDIQLREGEVSLIGGIIQDTATKSLTGVPGLAHIPLLGRLFSADDTEKNKTELVIALIPHIVRGPDITASNLKGVASGSSSQVKVSYDTSKFPYDGVTDEPAAATTPGSAASPAPAAPLPTVVASPVTGPAANVPATAPRATAPTVMAPPATAPPMTAPPATAPPATAPPMTAPPMTAPPMTAPAPRLAPPGGVPR